MKERCRCEGCRMVFDEPTRAHEYLNGFYHEIGICPFCGNDDIDWHFMDHSDDEEEEEEEDNEEE